MLISVNRSRRLAAGFTLVELMISIVIGLIVIGAVITFTVSTVQAYGENIRSTRLTQDLRTSVNVITRELRRAGFDSASVTRVLTSTTPSNFNAVTVNGNCVTYEYDRGVGGWGGAAAATELRGVRLNTASGALQLNASGAAVSCGGTSADWVDISDPQVVEITKFTPRIYQSRFCTNLGTTAPTPPATAPTYQIAQGAVRNLAICVQGRLRADNSIVRQVGNVTRIRSEDVQFVNDSATPCPALVPDPLPTLTDFNQTCAAP